MKIRLLITSIFCLGMGLAQAQAPTDAQWTDFWADFRESVNSGTPEKIWNHMIFPIPGNGVDQESFLADFGTYFPQTALIGILEYDPADLEVINNYLVVSTSDGKLIKMAVDKSGFTTEYYFGRLEDTIFLLDIK